MCVAWHGEAEVVGIEKRGPPSGLARLGGLRPWLRSSELATGSQLLARIELADRQQSRRRAGSRFSAAATVGSHTCHLHRPTVLSLFLATLGALCR